MSFGVEGLAAERAGGTTGFHDLGAVQHEAGDLVACRGDAGHCALFAFLDQLLDEKHEVFGVLVVGDAERADDPLGIDGFDEVEVGRKGCGRWQVRQQRAQVADEGGNLGLLELEGDELPAAAGLQVEDALAGRPDGAGREVLHLTEVVRLSQDNIS